MTADPTSVRSRRVVLLSGLGGLVAAVAASLGRPLPVRGIDGDDVLVGGTYTGSSPTVIDVTGEGPALEGKSANGRGLAGTSVSNIGVVGTSTHAAGVKGQSVWNQGMVASSQNGDGLQAASGGAYGNAVSANAGGGHAVLGVSTSSTRPAILGLSQSGVTGVQGFSGAPDTQPLPPLSTGIFGYANQDDLAVGVRGDSPLGTGGWFSSSAGTALRVGGKASFSRSGRVAVGAGRAYADVDLRTKGGLAGTPLILATLQFYRSGVYVAGVRANYPSSGKFRIYLNKAVTSATYVAYFVIS